MRRDVEIKAPAMAVVVTMQTALLGEARRLLDAGEYAASIVIAQAASEVYVERLLAGLCEERGIEYLWPAMRGQARSFNLNPDNKPLRKLYEALSEDAGLTSAPFWTDNSLREHVERRNDVAHKLANATREDAEASLAVVKALMDHLDAACAARRSRES